MKNSGILAALGAYVLWGLLPIYWKLVQQVSALEIVAHRMVWSLVFALALLALTRSWDWLGRVRARPALALPFVVTGALIFTNWLVYIWAVNHGHIVDASLGYFINPLVNVLLGVVFLRERLRVGQWVAVAVALAGVSYLTWSLGQLPWIALFLAFSFGVYGLVRKTATLASLEGFTLETGFMSLPAAVILAVLAARGELAFGHQGPATSALLAFTGVITAVPLLLFAVGARRVTLTTLGILQYVAPTMQFLLGVVVYGEAFPLPRLVGFSLVWTSLAIYTLDSYRTLRRREQVALAGP
ncbi:MAG: EamA family transporter RarD [Caldilineales bacterium]|nr:EamA family transporter RarD [Caldilineales bacterium]MDW8318295.1 EamA family transporter RarD [Anaerolineae bacterium]